MEAIRPDVTTHLRLLSASEGGRRSATPSNHLGCIFEYGDENFECRLLLSDIGPISPGGQAMVPIKFLRPELIKQRLSIGSRFKLREVGIIGEGIVESIIE